jgi:divalent metal cation (Fe/Co/Zn/Cd) transporter
MANFYFERECRTAFSECYTILKEENALGRVDIHFAETVVHATLSISENLTTEEIQDLIDTIDEELLDSVGITRDEVIVHVHQGRDLGVFSTRNFEGNGGHQRMG